MQSRSLLKNIVDTHGYWERISKDSHGVATICGTALRRKISSITPMRDWWATMVCVAELKEISPLENAKIGDGISEACKVCKKVYELPTELDSLVADLFSLSLTHNIVDVDSEIGTLYVMESKDGTTNINEEVIGLLCQALKLPFKTLYEELQGQGVVE